VSRSPQAFNYTVPTAAGVGNLTVPTNQAGRIWALSIPTAAVVSIRTAAEWTIREATIPVGRQVEIRPGFCLAFGDNFTIELTGAAANPTIVTLYCED
jgi:hypothetical protein